MFRPSLHTQAGHGSKERDEELVDGGSAKIQLYVKETGEGLFMTPSPATGATEVAMHVNQKKRLHIFLEGF